MPLLCDVSVAVGQVRLGDLMHKCDKLNMLGLRAWFSL